MKKHSRFLTVIVPVLLLSVALMQVQVYHVSTPELFGDGTAYIVGSERIAGFIDGWGTWIIYGKREDCRIIQIGRTVGDAVGKIPCHMDFRNETRFAGWIDFRGHPRKFCGALDIDSMPRKCYGD